MALMSWSRTWTTKRTTTTSRKPVRWNSKNFRWKRMFLPLWADQRLKQNHEDLPLLTHPQKLYPSGTGSGLMLSQKIVHQSLTQCQTDWLLFFVMVICFEKKMERLNSGDLRKIFGTNLRILGTGLMKWKSTMAKGWRKQERFQYCPDPSGQEILHLRALQGHSGRNLIDPSLQDHVVSPNDFFEYIYHKGCAINLHSIVKSGLTPGGQNLSKRQTVFFLAINPRDKGRRPESTASCTASAEYRHKS